MTFRLILSSIWFGAALWAWPGAAAAEEVCKTEPWTEIRPLFMHRSGCLTDGDRQIRFQGLAFDLSAYELGLRGAAPNGKLPTLDDVANAGKGGTASPAFTLEKSVKPDDLVIANVGYPEDAGYFTASGLVRIGGTDLADRDTDATFKNAMFCLNEAEYNKIGSRVVIFNAFEDFRPIQLNERLDADNCKDVVQIGPKVVEYRGQEAIKQAEMKKSPQKYAVFAQGNGGAKSGTGFYGYIFIFEDPVHLFQIQKHLLSADAGYVDTKMRTAVVMTTDAYSGLGWRAQDGNLKTLGAVSRPHPVFLTVKTFQPQP